MTRTQLLAPSYSNERNPGRALKEALDRGCLLISMEVAEELAEVLCREKFDCYVRRKIREEFLVAIIQEATLVKVSATIQECRDSKDNKFLELAISGGASCIITGDEDLLVLNPFRGISIVTPKQFLESLDQACGLGVHIPSEEEWETPTQRRRKK